MCGIVGYVGGREACPILLKGLHRLEYRGYDSAGVAMVDEDGALNVYKCKGKVSDLEHFLAGKELGGNIGIAHTRWATHGVPNDVNAHPHCSESENIALIHNGIIENYRVLKDALEENGYTFRSSTDSEVLVNLIEYIRSTNACSLLEAVQQALRQVVGAYAIAVVEKNNRDEIIAARQSSPMAIGIGRGEYFLSSDAASIIEYTQDFVYVNDGEIAVINRNKPLKIVTTIFPEYDWVREILGDKVDHAEVTMLLDNGVDLHSYQPTADDIIKISDCDLFIYVGGESDGWVEDALKEATNKDMRVINLLDVLGERVKEEEVVEGMEAEEEESVDEDEPEYDEHVWLSLKNAETLCNAITDALEEIDPANKDAYAANAASYLEKLAALDGEYQAVVDNAVRKTVLFGDRFPFRYLVDDYGLSYYAAFAGCSAETEASFETISFLAGRVDELGLPCVLTIEGAQHKIAETIVQNSAAKNQSILTLDSMQSTTSADAANGTTYLSVMESNLVVLKQALN